jgi:hypothetical protein
MEIFSFTIQGSSVGANNMNLSMNDGFDFVNNTAQRQILTDPAFGTTVFSNYVGSQTAPTLYVGVEPQGIPVTNATIKLDGDVGTPTTLIIKSYNADSQDATINITSGDDLGTSPVILLECFDNLAGKQSSIQIQGTDIIFQSPNQFLRIGELLDNPTSLFSSFIKFDTARGMFSQSKIETVTTGSTTLNTSQNAYRTTINTPSAVGRQFVLPAFTIAPSSSGVWYAICNKSTLYTIEVCFPTVATTIFTIPVSPTGGAGSVARFAVDSANTAYFRDG